MHGPREVLNGLKWTTGLDASIEVWFTHRGAPHDTKVVTGADIRRLDSWFFELDAPPGRSGTIPYHRVQRVTRGGETLWARGPGAGGASQEP